MCLQHDTDIGLSSWCSLEDEWHRLTQVYLVNCRKMLLCVCDLSCSLICSSAENISSIDVMQYRCVKCWTCSLNPPDMSSICFRTLLIVDWHVVINVSNNQDYRAVDI